MQIAREVKMTYEGVHKILKAASQEADNEATPDANATAPAPNNEGDSQ